MREPLHRFGAGALAVTVGVGVLAVVFGRLSLGSPAPVAAPDRSPRVEVVARNLNNPRGLTVTPQGTVLVAEAGKGGNGRCLPSPENPDGKVCLGATGSITVIGPTGQRRIINGLASIAAHSGRNAIGPSDITFAEPDRMVVSMGVVNETTRRKELGILGAPLGTVREFRLSGGSRSIADLSAFENRTNSDGGRRDSNPNAVLALDDRRVAVIDSGTNQLLVVDAQGNITPLANFPTRDIPRPPGFGSAPPRPLQQQAPAGQAQQGQGQAQTQGTQAGQSQTQGTQAGQSQSRLGQQGQPGFGQGQPGQGRGQGQGQGQAGPGRHGQSGQARPGRMLLEAVPTSVTRGPDGALYVGELTGFPFPSGMARVWRVVPGEKPTIHAKGFTSIIDLAFDGNGRLHVLEIAKNGLHSPDRTGALIRVEADGKHTELLHKQLTAPGGMAFGPGQTLFISNHTTSPGIGEVLRVQF